MSINLPVPQNIQNNLYQLLSEILRRSVDGSINPIQLTVDVNLTSGDIKIVTPGTGLILSNRSGTQYYRLVMEDDGVISADPI